MSIAVGFRYRKFYLSDQFGAKDTRGVSAWGP
jgi:hypothetical protein